MTALDWWIVGAYFGILLVVVRWATAKNQGTAAAGSSTTRYYLSLNTNKGSDDILLSETSSVGKLAAGAIAFSGTVAVMIPSTTPGGTYYLLACANDTTKVKESNETNNCVASTTQLVVIR